MYRYYCPFRLLFSYIINFGCYMVQKCCLKFMSICTWRNLILSQHSVKLAIRGGWGIALPILNHGTRRVWLVNATSWPLLPWRRDLVPIVQKVGWASDPVWMCSENLIPTEVWIPNCPATSDLLYQLHYPGHFFYHRKTIIPMIRLLSLSLSWYILDVQLKYETYSWNLY